jgi:choice-of-anchor B domain-containing protein
MYRHSFLPLAGLLAAAAAAPLTGQGGNFGSAVQAGDREVFIGEPLNQYSSGLVYVYRPDASGRWRVAARLTAADAQNNDHFGRSLSLDGSTLLIGATVMDSSRGAAYIFERGADGGWKQTARLSGSDLQPNEALGRVVALSGDVAAVTSLGKDSIRGAVYLFRRGPGGWSQTAKLEPDDLKPNDQFGISLAFAGDYLFVGAAQQDSGRGVVYVFHRDAAGGWAQDAKVSARRLEARSRFGSAIAPHGSELLIAAPGAAQSTGAVYVFRQDSSGGPWSETGRLLPFDVDRFTQFGASIGFDGDAAWVGAPGANGFTGRIYRIRRDTGGAGVSVDKLGADSLERGDGFGSVFSLRGTVAVVGVSEDDFEAGTAVIFTKTAAGVWQSAGKVWSEHPGLAAVTGGRVDCTGGKATMFSCNDVDLLSFLPVSAIGGRRGVQVNDMWGWTDPRTGREYALVGRVDGTAFVDVSDPQHPVYLGSLPKTAAARAAIWRDIKVYKNHAFIVSDGAGPHGMQIFDLTRLRSVRNPPVTFTEDAHYDRINSAHNIAIDTSTGFAFTVGNSEGGETCGGGLHMINIQAPTHPVFAGCFSDPTTGRAGTGYTHDAQCVVYHGPDRKYQGREICFGANETALSIADVTDKAHPVALARAPYPNVGYAHQGWLTDDQHYFYMDDELDELQGLVTGTRTLIWDVSNLADPVLAGEYVSKNHAIDHNLYILGHYAYESNYLSGLRILDIADILHPVEVGFFDTVPVGDDVPQFGGSWSNYPFFKSGTIVVTSMSEGIFMLRPHQRTAVP